MQKSSTQWLAFLALMLVSNVSWAQRMLTGRVTDGTSPVAGASVVITGSQVGTSTDASGKFTLATNDQSGQLEIKFLGFLSQLVKFSNTTDLGTISITPSNAQSLDEIIVVGRGIIDIAEGRKTPIAVSTIRQQEIEEKVGAMDITSTLVNTPSVYVTSQARGFGESSMTTRGFDQSNTAFLLNGQPINGMDNGSVYWSNWSGLTDIASLVQIQRGLGSSKLAISSVGGTINFVTKATDKQQGGFIKGTVGNDGFVKGTIGYNTGLMSNGWAVSAMVSHWQGDGYMDNTSGQGQNYFVSLGYKLNEKHNFNLMLTGAPQSHAQGFTSTIKKYQENGIRFNGNNSTINGESINPRKNYYHKPVANFNWDWKIDENANLSTVVYGSVARGGGQSSRKDLANVPYLAADVNNHQWFGIVSNYNRQLNENWNFNLGFDLRDYKGTHFRQATDLLGANSITHAGNVNFNSPIEITDTYTTNPWKAFSDYPKDSENKLAWEYNQKIRYGGLFGQIEYAKNDLTAFFQGSVSHQSNIREDYYQYTPGNEVSQTVNNFGYNVKGGVSYTIADQHIVFGNAGYYSRQPYQNNIFMNHKNDVNDKAVNEDILGLELGYKFLSRYVDVNVNAYRTTWANRVTGSSRVATAADVTKFNPKNDPLGVQIDQYLYYSNYGVKQDHKGLELDVVARPFEKLDIKGFASLGEWVYRDSATTIVRDENRNVLETTFKDLDGGHVGNAAQTMVGFGAKYKILANLSVDADFRYYDRLYSSLQAKNPLQLPGYNIVDAGVSYRVKIDAKNALSFRFNVNNLFEQRYISESSTNLVIDKETTGTYRGLDDRNQVLFGWGRTWNASVKYTF